jgi:N-dimethylarginine dimethylaminohydrolase
MDWPSLQEWARAYRRQHNLTLREFVEQTLAMKFWKKGAAMLEASDVPENIFHRDPYFVQLRYAVLAEMRYPTSIRLGDDAV